MIGIATPNTLAESELLRVMHAQVVHVEFMVDGSSLRLRVLL